jgi:hypothetical protein
MGDGTGDLQNSAGCAKMPRFEIIRWANLVQRLLEVGG